MSFSEIGGDSYFWIHITIESTVLPNANGKGTKAHNLKVATVNTFHIVTSSVTFLVITYYSLRKKKGLLFFKFLFYSSLYM